jgi:hypothetical protein
VLGPVVGREHYGGIGVYGVVTAALGAETIAGSLVGIAWRPRRPMRLAMLFALLWPLATMLYATGVLLAVVIPVTVVHAGADRRRPAC